MADTPSRDDAPLIAARAQLEEARTNEVPGLVALDDGHYYMGWHPVVAYFTIRRRHPEAPEHLPAFMASLEEAEHVHAGGASPKDALEALVGLYQRVAAQLAGGDED